MECSALLKLFWKLSAAHSFCGCLSPLAGEELPWEVQIAPPRVANMPIEHPVPGRCKHGFTEKQSQEETCWTSQGIHSDYLLYIYGYFMLFFDAGANWYVKFSRFTGGIDRGKETASGICCLWICRGCLSQTPRILPNIMANVVAAYRLWTKKCRNINQDADMLHQSSFEQACCRSSCLLCSSNIFFIVGEACAYGLPCLRSLLL